MEACFGVMMLGVGSLCQAKNRNLIYVTEINASYPLSFPGKLHIKDLASITGEYQDGFMAPFLLYIFPKKKSSLLAKSLKNKYILILQL
jgi:hypothetical protein